MIFVGLFEILLEVYFIKDFFIYNYELSKTTK